MELEIEKMLENPPRLENEADFRSFIVKIKKKIVSYEKSLMEEGSYNRETELLVNVWRGKILSIISDNKRTYRGNQISEKHKDVLETVKIASRQIEKADTNLNLLDNSTLKLVGLNYSSKDIENELNKTRDILAKSKADERRERFMVYLGALILLFVSLIILVDKFFIR